MTILEKILNNNGLKLAVALSVLSSIPMKFAVDEIPKKCSYVQYPITMEERLEEAKMQREKNLPDRKVLARATELIGKKVPKGEDICCWTAVKYVYDSAGVLMNCAYAVTGGESYKFKNEITKGKYESVTVGKTVKEGRIVIEPIASSKCLSNDGRKKLENISPGDILSYLIDGRSGHNAIFMKWKDEKNKVAELFDWGARDSQGKSVYRIYETNLDDDSHPVFYYWEPRKK